MHFFISMTGVAIFAFVGTTFSLPEAPLNVTILKATYGQNTTISYKQTYDCEMTPGVKAYAGYIHFQPSSLASYPQNIFFLFYESRVDPKNAPLVLWISGGPGESSTMAAYGENGPCIVQSDSTTVKTNPLSWNNAVNMLYLDQPVATGFSYDFLVNGTSDKLKSSDNKEPLNWSSEVPAQNSTFLHGTFASQENTVNTTANSAPIVWTALQVWMQSFPRFGSTDSKINIWSQSYGGLYAIAFATYFEKQNIRIKAGLLRNSRLLNVESVGIINGYIDMAVQLLAYPQFAYNKNTYGVQRITKEAYLNALSVYPACIKQLIECRTTAAVRDPDVVGADKKVNEICLNAIKYCFNDIKINPYKDSGYDPYDIARTTYQSQWPRYATGYLNQAHIQQTLGVPLNFTLNSDYVFEAFQSTGDGMRGAYLEKLASLVSSGIKVALLYGDRDYQCNWIGGERVSLAIPFRGQKKFAKAGYTDFVSNGTVAGQVRQYDNLSFTRVYQAGHEIPYDQPQAVYDIFMRTILGKDISSGKTDVKPGYATKGLSSIAFIQNIVPKFVKQQCYLWAVVETCDDTEFDILSHGVGIIKNYLLVGYYGSDGNAVKL